MKCPFCKQDHDRVVDSRTTDEGQAIRRRRECLECERRYTTYERVQPEDLRVIKKDGRREVYDRSKVVSGLLRACQKRAIPRDDIERLVDNVERELYQGDSREIPIRQIGEAVIARLRELDQVAYVRFASVYRDFQDVGEFVKEARPMMKGPRGGRDSGSRK